MDFRLTKEQRMIQDMSREFAEKEIMPRAGEMDEKAEFPYDIAGKMAELGMMGIHIPEKYGGSGGDCVSLHLCMEEISRGDVSLGALLDVTCGMGEILNLAGTEEQKQRWLPPIAKGQKIGSFGLTEPGGGSDAGAIETRAVLKGDEWVINGSKMFITNAGLKNMSLMLVIAAIGERTDGRQAINAFIVPAGTPGMDIGPKLDKLGWRASDTHAVYFEDCRIPKDHILGEEGHGFAQALAGLQNARISMAAISLGLARACYDAGQACAGRHQRRTRGPAGDGHARWNA